MEKNDNYIVFFAIAGFVLLILFIILISLRAIITREARHVTNTVQTNTTIVENTVDTPEVVEEENSDLEMSFWKLEGKKENLIYSPLSIRTALKMLEEGADGNSKDEIVKVFGEKEATQYEGEEGKISFANSVFVRDSYEANVKEEYKKALEKFKAEIRTDSFENANNVNEWIKEKTFGILQNVIEDTDVQDEDMKMILINALAIDLEWKNQFDPQETYSGEFTLDNGDKVNAAMMTQKSNSLYLKYNNERNMNVISMELEDVGDTTLEFIAIMPDEALDEYLQEFDMNTLDEVINNLKDASNSDKEIKVVIPKFKYDYKLNFKDDLKKLGINDVFDRERADLSKMADSIDNLYISNALHKADIEFSEQGVKAAAVTALFARDEMAMLEEEKPIEIVFNKPFAYFIRDTKNGEIWFVGTMYEPTKWEDNQISQGEQLINN